MSEPLEIDTVAGALGLTMQQARIVIDLISMPFVSAGYLNAYVASPNMAIYRLRERLNKHGVLLETVVGAGYLIREEGREVILKKVEEFLAPFIRANSGE